MKEQLISSNGSVLNNFKETELRKKFIVFVGEYEYSSKIRDQDLNIMMLYLFQGDTFEKIAETFQLEVDEVLRIHSRLLKKIEKVKI